MRYSLCLFAGLLLVAKSDLMAQEVSLHNSVEEIRGSFGEQLDQDIKSLVTYYDSIKNNASDKAEILPEDLGVIMRMRNVTKTIPLDYNTDVKAYVEKYTSENWRPYMNRLLGLSRHYFSIYDKVFGEVHLPQEIKYLSLVESSLNPHLISTSGAVGPWQFIYGTAREYDLNMDSNVDERKDAYASCYAVSKYLQTSYDQFNDWLLAVASYNCGRGCVQRAIKRSGLHQPTFWELAPFLPRETRNYIPKFIAMTYVMSNADHYDIQAADTELSLKVKALMVDKNIDLRNVAQALGITLTDLKYYNPAFKKDLIAASSEKQRRLLLPQTNTVNDSLLYLSLNTNNLPVIQAAEESSTMLASNNNVKDSGKLTYRIKEGETLASVSRKFDVSVQDLRSWNKLSSRSVIIGRDLIVERPINTQYANNIKSAQSKKKAESVTYYVVKKGDSLERIAKRFDDVSVSKLKADNNIKNSLIKPGMKLKIKKG